MKKGTQSSFFHLPKDKEITPNLCYSYQGDRNDKSSIF